MSTWNLGIDLGVTNAHTAVLATNEGKFVWPKPWSFSTREEDLDQLDRRVRRAAPPGATLCAVMEPTGMSWFSVAVALQKRGWQTYRVKSQKVQALRQYYKKHAKSDRLDGETLAKMPLVDEEGLYPLYLPDATTLACQRLCKQREHFLELAVAAQNRIQAIDHLALPGLGKAWGAPFSPAARAFRDELYDPREVLALGEAGLNAFCARWTAEADDPAAARKQAQRLYDVCQNALALYRRAGPEPAMYLDYTVLCQEVRRELHFLALYEQQVREIEQAIWPLYRQLHPSGYLESIYGVGVHGAPIFVSFIGDPYRFASLREWRAFVGLIPESAQSTTSDQKGLHITQAGQDILKKYAYLGADVARHYDPQIAAIYYDQMVNKGNHHIQAVCACATHLLDRILVVLQEGRPYELRDVDGRVVTPEEARAIIAQKYTVPKEVRARLRKQRAR